MYFQQNDELIWFENLKKEIKKDSKGDDIPLSKLNPQLMKISLDKWALPAKNKGAIINPILEDIKKVWIRESTVSLSELFDPERDFTLADKEEESWIKLRQISMVLEEAITNWIQHGNEFDANCYLKICYKIEENWNIIIKVIDKWEWFDTKDRLKEVKDQVKTEQKAKTWKKLDKKIEFWGRWTFIFIKPFTEKFEYNNEGNELTMYFKK